MGKYNHGYEGEILLEFNDVSQFQLAKKDMLPNDRSIQDDYEYTRPSIYMDTNNLDLFKCNASFLLRPTSEEKTGAIIKYEHSSLVKERLLIRAEQSSLIELHDMKKSEFLKCMFGFLGISMNKELLVQLIVTQKRTHKSTISLENKLHLSFDEVNYFNAKKEYIATSYIMEIEITNKDLSKLHEHYANSLALHYIEKYNAKKINFNSKYSHGLNLLKKTQPI